MVKNEYMMQINICVYYSSSVLIIHNDQCQSDMAILDYSITITVPSHL